MAERDAVSPVNRPTPNRGGRPSSLTPRVRKVIIAAIDKGASYRLAALAAGVSPDALGNWRRLGAEGDARYAGFVRDLGKAEAKAAERWLAQINAAAARGTWTAAAWLLERRHRDEYAQRTEHPGPDGGAIPLPPRLSVQERNARLEAFLGNAISRRAAALAAAQTPGLNGSPNGNGAPS